MVKTNAVRVLDGLGISSELREYTVDPDDLSAETVAPKIGFPPEQLFKTLVVRGDRHGIYLALIPANAELDFKALARRTGDRKVDMVPLKDVQAATGYIRGGVTALACKKDYPVYIDELAQICDVISISAWIMYAFSQADLSVVRGEKGSEWQAQLTQKCGVARVAAQVL